MPKVLVIGEVCVDILMHHPKSVEALGQKIWAEDIKITAGGSAAYASAALAAMGAEVLLCSSVGDDDMGQRTLQQLREMDVSCDNIAVLKGCSTTCSIAVCDGCQKEFVGCSPMLPITIPNIEDVSGVDLIYIAGYMIYPDLHSDKAYNFFSQAKKNGTVIALDGQFLPAEEGTDIIGESRLDRMFSIVDVFFAARKEARQLVGSSDPQISGERLLKKGCGVAVLKQGADGCVIVTEQQTHVASSYPVDVYDTVGSGDVFGASYAYGFINGWDMKKCAEFATVFSALTLKRYDKSKDYPSLAQVQQIMQEREQEEKE